MRSPRFLPRIVVLTLAVKPLGSISASFYALENEGENEGGRLGARLLFNVKE